MDFKKHLEEWVKAHQDEFLSDLSELIAIRSVRGDEMEGMPFGPGPAEALSKALEMCEKYGFSVKNYENYVGTADLCRADTVLDILVHVDVVGEGEGWDSDPYSLRLADGCIYGRGVADDKGPLLASLYAMRAVRDSGLELTRNARLILGTDEESGFNDLPFYYAKERPAPNTFSPDAGFPVYNVEKGRYTPVITKTWEKEDCLPRLVRLEGGYRINVVPAQAGAVIAGLAADVIENRCAPLAEKLGVELSVAQAYDGVKLAVTGTDTHAAFPESGNNGLTALLALLYALPLAECSSTQAVRELAELFPHGDHWGQTVGIAQADELSGELTLAFTLLSVDETGLRGEFDSRAPICANDDNCRFVFEKRLNDMGYAVTGDMGPAHYTPEDTPFIQTLLRCYEQYTGLEGKCGSMGGSTYVHGIKGGVAFGAGMPDYATKAHGANENMELDSLLTACKIYAQVIADMCCGR